MWDKIFNVMKVMLIIGFIIALFKQSCRADWFRIQSSTPVKNRTHYFVATYMFRGPVDYSIPQSTLSIYLTTVYDLTKTPACIFNKFTNNLKSSNAAHHEANDYIVSRTHFENDPVTQPPSPMLNGERIVPYDRFDGIFLELD